MPNIKTPSSMRIIVFSLLALVCFLFGSLWVYIWATHKIDQLKVDLLELAGQIDKIEIGVAKEKTVEEGIRLLHERQACLNSKFPAREEEGLRWLSDSARKFNIKVIAIRSQHKMPVVDQDQQKTEVEGKTFQKLPISIEMKSSYEDFLEYLNQLEQFSPGYFAVEDIRMRKGRTPDSLGVEINLNINLYLLS